MRKEIDEFLKAEAFGVVGASSDRSKYGNRVLRCYQEHGLKAVPVNPKEKEIEGTACVASVLDLPADVASISVITPPLVTEQVVEQAAEKGDQERLDAAGGREPAGGCLMPRARHQRHRRRELHTGGARLPGALSNAQRHNPALTSLARRKLLNMALPCLRRFLRAALLSSGF